MSIGTVALRGIVGPLFVGHGTQKLFGWFGGHGLEGTGGFFESIGLRPGKRHAAAAGVVRGARRRAADRSAPRRRWPPRWSPGTMITAIRKVHAPNGPWVTENGFEYNAVLIAAMAALVDRGPGSPSVDAKLFPNWHGRAGPSPRSPPPRRLLPRRPLSEPAPEPARRRPRRRRRRREAALRPRAGNAPRPSPPLNEKGAPQAPFVPLAAHPCRAVAYLIAS